MELAVSEKSLRSDTGIIEESRLDVNHHRGIIVSFIAVNNYVISQRCFQRKLEWAASLSNQEKTGLPMIV